MALDKFGRTLLQGGFEGVSFTVVEASAEGGNDVIEHTAYLRPGSEIEFAGRRAERGKLHIAVLDDIGDGDNWEERYVDIIRKFRENPIGELTHPLEGIFDAAIVRWSTSLAPDQRSGVYIDVEWIEHNGSIQEQPVLTTMDEDSPSSTVSQAALADALGTETDDSGNRLIPTYTEVSSTITEQLEFIESEQRTRSEITAAFRTMQEAVDTRLALPELDSATYHEVTASLEALKAQILSLRTRYFPSFALESTFVVPTEMTVWEVANLMYGDVGYSNLVLANNSISDPFFIRQGTTLRILPIQ